MKRYQIKDWELNFENAKSRTIEQCRWCPVPNKQHGMGLRWLLAQPQGVAVYGIFNLIVGACSQQRLPRNGWLTDDGRETGRPWAADDLAMRWPIPGNLIGVALETLSATRTPCGWIVATEVEATTNDQVSPEYPPSIPEVTPRCTHKGMEEKGREGNGSNFLGTGSSAEPAVANSAASSAGASRSKTAKKPEDSSPIVLTFPTVHGKISDAEEWHFRRDYAAKLSTAFIGVNVPVEAKKALLWIEAKPANRKTAAGMPEFLQRWMSRAQNAGGSRNHPTEQPRSAQRARVDQ